MWSSYVQHNFSRHLTMCSTTGDGNYNESPAFKSFKHQLYHTSIAAILRLLLPGMSAPVICQCLDRHFRQVIYDLAAFIADHPEQILLIGIIQGWCPRWAQLFSLILILTISMRCTTFSNNLDTYVLPCTPEHTDRLSALYSLTVLWNEYGIVDDIIVSFFCYTTWSLSW